jgi:hypothetical protein
MPRKPLVLADVRALAAALPGVQDTSGPRGVAFKANGKLLACTAIHPSAEPGSLAVRIDPQLRAELLASEPEVYYLTPHYAPYPTVLVRIARIGTAGLRKLLGTALLFVTSHLPARPQGTPPNKAAARTPRAAVRKAAATVPKPKAPPRRRTARPRG